MFGCGCTLVNGSHGVWLQVTRVRLSEDAAAQWGLSHAWEHRIRLQTGRTHQIRTQLAAVAAPVLGDRLYTALIKQGLFHAAPSRYPCDHATDHAQSAVAGTALHVSASEPEPEQTHTSSGSAAELEALKAQNGTNGGVQGEGEVPKWVEEYRDSVRQEAPLGLQANELQVQNVTCMGTPPVVFSAGCPWWRCSGT